MLMCPSSEEVLNLIQEVNGQMTILSEETAQGPTTGPAERPFRRLMEVKFERAGDPKPGFYGYLAMPRVGPKGYSVISVIKDSPTGPMVLFAVQYCIPRKTAMVSVIEGINGDDEETSARKEVKEETGCEVANIVAFGRVFSKPKLVNDGPCHYFVAAVQSEGEQELEKEEAIKIIALPLLEAETILWRWVANGVPVNEACFAAISAAKYAKVESLL